MLRTIEFLKNKVSDEELRLDDNYQEIKDELSGCVTAVDGGCVTIADGGAWIISKIRTASVKYDKGEYQGASKQETYYTIIKNNGFEHSINRLRTNFKNIRELSEAVPIIMRTLEYEQALKESLTMNEGSLLLIDGLIQAETNDQERLINQLEVETKRRGVNVIGLAKTFRHSINGRSIIGRLIKNKPTSKWFYAPIKGSDCYIIKLHDKASYAYAFNSFNHTNIEESIAILNYYSKDPEIIGYPYPLLKVDRVARINSYERLIEGNKLKIICKKQGIDFIKFDQLSTNMHSLMDKQKYR